LNENLKLNFFKFDPNFEEEEEKWNEIKNEILGDEIEKVAS